MGGDVTEFLTHGRETFRENVLYLILKYWDGSPSIKVNDLLNRVKRASILSTNQSLTFSREGDDVILSGLPAARPDILFPVIRLELDGEPRTNEWGDWRNWQGDPRRVAHWAAVRGETVWVSK